MGVDLRGEKQVTRARRLDEARFAVFARERQSLETVLDDLVHCLFKAA